jgi:DHA1 family inner membrane transport protein
VPFLPLLALTLAAFAIGTTEFAVQGLLPEISRALGVSIPATGLLVTGYALGVAFGGPILTIATNRLRRRTALLSLLAIFVVGHVLCAIAPTYALLLLARIVASFCHGAFMGNAFGFQPGNCDRSIVRGSCAVVWIWLQLPICGALLASAGVALTAWSAILDRPSQFAIP